MTTTIKERPILFSGPMVRAILEGRKTQTRRVVKPRTIQLFDVAAQIGECRPLGVHEVSDVSYYQQFCPYGAPGDRLWVRETWAVLSAFVDRIQIFYHANGDGLNEASIHPISNPTESMLAVAKRYLAKPKYPSIHMPRWASRILLEVVSVRVERLQAITEEDASAEGVSRFESPHGCGLVYPRQAFAELWESLNATRAPWDSNPWVWVIEFMRVDP